MNKERRKAIEEITNKLSELAQQIIDLQEQEQEYYDNIPESFQQGDKGQAAESAISAFDEANSSIESAIDSLNEAAAL